MDIVDNARWAAISQLSRVGMQLAGMMLLSRLLAPGDFGVMAMALAVINLAYLLRDLGTSAAIVQRRELDDRTIGAVFGLNLIVGAGLALVICAASAGIGYFFRSNDLPSLLMLLSLVFPVSASSAVFQSLLERESKFRLLARIEITSGLCGLLTSAALAWHGAGVVCLAAQTLVTVSMSAIQLWRARTWTPSGFGLDGIRSIVHYSGNLTLFNLINYFARNADSLIIGRMLGSAALGVYSQAYKVMLFPVQNLTFIATRALFPVMSRLQDQRPQARDVYLRTVTLIVGLTGPLMGGVWIVRAECVELVFGHQWGAVVPILAWLAPVGFIQSIVSTTGTVFMAFGQTKRLMHLGIIATVLQVGAFVIGAGHDVVVVAGLYCVANLINFAIAMHATMRQFDARLGTLMGGIGPAIGATAFALAAAYLMHAYLSSAAVRGPLVLAGTILTEAAVYAAIRFDWIISVLVAAGRRRAQG